MLTASNPNPPTVPPLGSESASTPRSQTGRLIGMLVILLLGGGIWWFLQPRFEPPQGAHLPVAAVVGAGLNQETSVNGTCVSAYSLVAYGDKSHPYYDLTLTLQRGGLGDEADVVAELATPACAAEQQQVLGQVLKTTKLTSAIDPSLSIMYRNQAGHRFILPIDQP